MRFIALNVTVFRNIREKEALLLTSTQEGKSDGEGAEPLSAHRRRFRTAIFIYHAI